MNPIDPSSEPPAFDFELMRLVLESSPYYKHLNMELLEAGDGFARVAMNLETHHNNTQGIVHGGALCSLADQTGLAAIGTQLKLGQRPRTVQMDVRYLAPGRGRRLIAEGRVMKMGGLVSFSDVDIKDETGRTVVAARCTCAIVHFEGDEKFK
ncbi:MAG: PaaI family thioesterase [Proteobacteria bacterium]|nr:PaaI family thioesterase [Pseudomonadota bacterium]